MPKNIETKMNHESQPSLAVSSRSKLKDAIWAYNYDRPHLAHQKFGKLTPVEFEESLKELSFELRPRLSIFTHSQNVDILDDSQLKFDF